MLKEQRQLELKRLLDEAGLFDEEQAIPVDLGRRSAALANAQQGIWLQADTRHYNAAFNIPLVLRLRDAEPDVAALEHSLTQILERHAVLRTTIRAIDGDPRQFVQPTPRICLPVEPVANENALEQRLGEHQSLRFDLQDEPPIRFRLFRLAATEHVLSIIVHHVACDGWSTRLLTDELGTFYAERVTGIPAALEPLPLQYMDFAAWEAASRILRQDDARAFWKRMIGDIPAVLDLPPPLPQAGEQGTGEARVKTFTVDLPRGTMDALRAFSLEHGTSEFAALMSTYAIVVGQLCAQERFCIGTPVSGRSRIELEPLIGCFSRIVPIGFRDPQSTTFAELVRAITADSLAAFDRAELSWEQIASIAQVERNSTARLSAQVMFAYHTQASGVAIAESAADLRIERHGFDVRHARYGLLLAILRGAEFDLLSFEYDAARFSERWITLICARFLHVLETVLDAPTVVIGQLPLLPPVECRWPHEDGETPDGAPTYVLDARLRPVPIGGYGRLYARSANSDGVGLLSDSFSDRRGARMADLQTWGRRLPDGIEPSAAPAVVPADAAPARPFAPDVVSGDDAPADLLEIRRLLARAWREALNCGPVGLDDNFFELGGDSILCLKVQSVAGKLGVAVDIADLFEHQTIRSFSRYCSLKARPAETDTAPFALILDADRERLPAQVESASPLSGLQAGMLFHSLRDRERSLYHDIVNYWLEGPLDIPSLKAAVADVFAHAEVLRTTVDLAGYSEALQLVVRSEAVPLAVVDHSASAPDRRASRIQDWMREEQRRGFDLRTGPLFRVALHTFDSEACALSFSFHHALLDGWSEALLATRVLERYALRLRAREIEPLEMSLPYREFIALERNIIADERAVAYWRATVDSLPQTAIPRVSASAEPTDSDDDVVRVAPEQSRALRQRANAWAVPLKSLLLAVHAKVLADIAEQDEIVTGMVFNGRPEREGGDTAIGMFLNTLPVRLRTDGGDWRALAQHCLETERGMMPFRRYPLTAVRTLAKRDRVFDVSFNFTHFHAYDAVASEGALRIVRRDGFAASSLAYAVDFTVEPQSGELLARLETPIDQRALVRAFAQAYEHAIASLLERPEQPLASLNVAGGAFRELPIDEAVAGPAASQPVDPRSPPRTPTERVVAAVWSDALEIDAVMRGDDFFRLGGHSLVAMRMVAQLEQVFAVDVPLSLLFEQPVLHGFCAALDADPTIGANLRSASAELVELEERMR